jgi:adenosylcobinamide-GDP ribazoletransferase
LSLLSGLKNSLAFLTVIPVGMDEDGVDQAAKYMFSFPLLAAIIGFTAGAVAWLLHALLPSLVVGMLVLAFILLMTGAHHTDGLLDFGDAVMFRGSSEKKMQVMHDQNTGAGGLSLGILILLTTAFCVASLAPSVVIAAMTASEASAKFAMVFQACKGRSAEKGLNTPFVDAMHGKRGGARMAIALCLQLAISLVALRLVGVIVTVAALLSAAAMLMISNSQFKGITGDVMGATNEVTRLVSLLVILVAAK